MNRTHPVRQFPDELRVLYAQYCWFNVFGSSAVGEPNVSSTSFVVMPSLNRFQVPGWTQGTLMYGVSNDGELQAATAPWRNRTQPVIQCPSAV